MARIRKPRGPVRPATAVAAVLPSVKDGSVAVSSPPRLHTAVDLNLPADENERRIAAWEARRRRGVAIMRARPWAPPQIWRPIARKHRQGMRKTKAAPSQARVPLRNMKELRARARARLLMHQSSPAPAPEPVALPVPPVPLPPLPPPVVVPPKRRKLRALAELPLPLPPTTLLLPPPPSLPADPAPPISGEPRVAQAHLGPADPPPPPSASVRRRGTARPPAVPIGRTTTRPPATGGPLKPVESGSPAAADRKRKRAHGAIGKAGQANDQASSPSRPIHLQGRAMPSREDDTTAMISWANKGTRSGSRRPRKTPSKLSATGPVPTSESSAAGPVGMGIQRYRTRETNLNDPRDPSSSAGPNVVEEDQESSSSNVIYDDVVVSQAADLEADDRPLPDASPATVVQVPLSTSTSACRGKGRRSKSHLAWNRLPAGLFNGPPETMLAAAEKTGNLSFYLRYAIRERTWLQENQLALTTRGQCCPPKDLRLKLRKLVSRKSQFQGVNCYRRTSRWEAHIWDIPKKLNGKQQYLGSCHNELEAARHYDRGSLKFRGPEAPMNFKSSSYDDCIKEIELMSKDQFLEWSRCMAKRCLHSKFFGTRFEAQRNKWKTEYKIQNPVAKKDGTLSRGFHNTEEEAARAYDIVSIEVSGADAITNHHISEYDIDSILNRSALNRNGLHRQEQKKALEQIHLLHDENIANVKNCRGQSRRRNYKGKEKVTSNQVSASTSNILPIVNDDPYAAHRQQLGPAQSDPTLTLAIAANAYDALHRQQFAPLPVTLRPRGAQGVVSLKTQAPKVMKQVGRSDNPSMRVDVMARFQGANIAGPSKVSKASDVLRRKKHSSAGPSKVSKASDAPGRKKHPSGGPSKVSKASDAPGRKKHPSAGPSNVSKASDALGRKKHPSACPSKVSKASDTSRRKEYPGTTMGRKKRPNTTTNVLEWTVKKSRYWRPDH